MNKDNLVKQLQLIYGYECQVCNIAKSVTYIHLVSLAVIRYSRNLNKRKSRRNKRRLPEINNYQLNNLLPVCNPCQVKQFNSNIYQLISLIQLKAIDRLRLQHDYPELITAGNIQNLHKLLASQNKHNERNHDASQKIT